MLNRLDRMKRKAQWQLTQQLIGPINQLFGPKSPPQKTKSELEDKRTGVIELTPEEHNKRMEELKELDPLEVARRDPNFLHPDAARKAMLAFSILLILIVLLVWFVCTCKRNSDRLKAQRAIHEQEQTEQAELRHFSKTRGAGGCPFSGLVSSQGGQPQESEMPKKQM